MPRIQKNKSPKAESGNSGELRAALKSTEDATVSYEKSVTLLKGNDYYRVTVGVTTGKNPGKEDLEEVSSTIEKLSGVIDDEVTYQVGELLRT